MKKLYFLGLLMSFFLAACEKPISPQANGFLDMRAASCATGSMVAVKPYVTESSLPTLEVILALEPLTKALEGQSMEDALAKDCQNPPKITNQLKVNNERYLIEFIDYPYLTGQQEVPVVLEKGQWKVELLGR